MHAACARQLSWFDSLLAFLCVSCVEKGIEGFAVTAVVFLGC